MKYLILLGFLGLCAAAPAVEDPDEKLDFDGVVRSRGFQLQVHEVTTPDGYILTVHRVVPKSYTAEQDRAYTTSRKPIIVNHGLASSASNFFLTSHELMRNNSKCGDNFGFCLVETGKYDIWLPNNRGNGFSSKHTHLNSSQAEFWHFTFDQLSKYDLPAVIELVRNKTGHKQVGYVGHSQGCAIMFGLLSERPEYADIVQPFIAWAPAVYVHHMKSLLKVAVPFMDYYVKLGNQLNLTELLASISGQTSLTCRTVEAEAACTKMLTDLCGPTDHLDHRRLAVYLHNFPAPVSMWQVVHFGQLYLSGNFTKFDYGTAEQNHAAYGTDHPPDYPLERISPKAKIVLMWGETDYMVSPEDVAHLHSVLKPILKDNLYDYRVPSKQFNHVDFVLGLDAGPLLYDKTIEYLDRFALANN